ncbi:FKBP-type peptidyl-prolyl cis-trans isomerase [Leifsonia sp. A12D58]|uniref:FKBP-type peptidyl-prolyl cis-trans isomerase n=1 Tax=Leifsonia sp. A12D58 TaxID=3397674 RepID=UPI0039E0ECEB
MRKPFALIATAALAMVALTGCSSASSDSAADCTPLVKDGPAAELVTVTGEFGKAPTVDFPTPLKTDTTERAVIIDGTGPGLVTGQLVSVDLSVYNGSTGAKIEESAYDGTSQASFALNDQTLTGLTDGLTCAQVGSRIAVVVAPDDAFGPQGGNAQLGVAADDSLVFVIDVVSAALPRANGKDQTVASNLPSVVLDENGVPGITIPSAEAPKTLEIGVLKKGSGATVKEGDSVIVNYTGVIWDTKKVFDSSWAKGSPVTLLAADGSKTAGGVIPGFADALIGQTVGSQIIAVIPPDQGYGDTDSGSIPAGSTLVFVVDILGIG